MSSLTDRLQHAWNAFMNRDPTPKYRDYGSLSYYRPDRTRWRRGNERSIIMAIYNRIAMDVASVDIKHVRLDDNGAYLEDIPSELNNCLQVEANIDQTARAFVQDLVLSMFDEGYVASVPVETTLNPKVTGSYDILSLRTGRITRWYPEEVTVEVYNEKIGRRQEVTLPKKMVALIENPLYAIMNEPNSTLQRLIRKLNLLDAIDEQSGAGKLDLIIQLPYVIKTDARRQQAEHRRKDIEMQLAGSKYGIAYTDGTERITQLNRSIDNNLMKQIEYLTSMLYSQLGLTEDVFKGTADEKAMLYYNNTTVEPILSAICDEYYRKFLTKTARTQRQAIKFFREPFKLVPVDNIAEIADKFTRNEILSSNEIRQIIGVKPSADPMANELRNKNLNAPSEYYEQFAAPEEGVDDYDSQLGDLDDIDSQLEELERSLGHSDLMHYASPYYDPVKAHEYYMKNRELKGRRSTAGLNEEGKKAAAYVKKQLLEEKKRRIKESSERTKEGIRNSSENTKANVKNSSEATKANIQSSSDRTKQGVKSSSERTKANIKSSSEATKNIIKNRSELVKGNIKRSSESAKAKVKAERELTKKKIEKEKEKTKQEIDSHKAQTQSKIDSLRESIKKMSASEKKVRREAIQQQIAALREANSQKRLSLREAYNTVAGGLREKQKESATSIRAKHKSYSTSQRDQKKVEDTRDRQSHKDKATSYREQHKSTAKGLRDEHKSTSSSLREQHKATASSYRAGHKSTSQHLRDQHKANSAAIKEDYERKLDNEMAKIKTEASYQGKKKKRRRSS